MSLSNNRNDNLTLKDYRKIRTPFVFFDETGTINDTTNRYFGLGMVKCMQPHFLDTKIRQLRQKERFFYEIKWNTISKFKVNFIKKMLGIVFNTPGIKFDSIIINKDEIDFKKHFSNNPYKAYQTFSEILIRKSIKHDEILLILADYVTTPSHIHFEVDVKHTINSEMNRLAIAGIHRIDSKGTNMLQINDLFLGAVIYDYKLQYKLVKGDTNKKGILTYIKQKLNTKSFVGGFRKNSFTVLEYK